jgi:hypothetical protein
MVPTAAEQDIGEDLNQPSPLSASVPNNPPEITEMKATAWPHKGTRVSNPWLKKNPFMSMWLSGANSVAHSARGKVAAEAKRQSTTAMSKAANDMFSLWTGSITPAPKRKRKR